MRAAGLDSVKRWTCISNLVAVLPSRTACESMAPELLIR